jgi:hypothetical protein
VVQSVILFFALSMSLIQSSQAEMSAGNEILKNIHQSLFKFPSYDGKCGSLKMAYYTGSQTNADQLQVSFISKGKSVEFSIFGVESKFNMADKPGLNWYEYFENGNLRINYQYLTFLKSETDLNSLPSQEGSKFLKVFIGLNPNIKRIVQFAVLIGEGHPDQSPKTFLWSELVGWVENCDDN